MKPHALTPRLALLLTLPPLLWAGNAVVGRLAVGTAPPVGLNFVRWLLAFALLWPLGRRALADRAAIAQRWPHLALLGLLGMGSYNALQYLALHSSTPLNVTLIAASMPAWMLGFGALLYGSHPSGRELGGAALSLAGVGLVISHGEPARLAALRFVPGDLLMLLAVVCWALYSWLLARPPGHLRGEQRPDWDWAGFLLVQIAFGLAWSGAAAGVEALVAPDARWHVSGALAAILLYVAIGPSLVAYRCWGLGVSTVGPAVAAFFSNLTPVFAAILSAALLGESPRWYHGVAFALIVAGIWLSARRRA